MREVEVGRVFEQRSPFARRGARERRGAALMMSLLVLFVLVLIVGQISIGTSTDYRTARNEVDLSACDSAIESTLLKVFQDLIDDAIQDAESGSAAGGAAGGLGGLGGGGGAAGGLGALLGGASQLPGMAAGGASGGMPGGGGAGGGPSDSRREPWATPQRTSEFAPIEVRVYIQPESAKYNVLQMLSEDEDEAAKALERVVRIIDRFREGTSEDVEEYQARRMAEAMRDWLVRRSDNDIARADLVTASEAEPDVHVPLSLRELLVLEEFEPQHFRDYRDDEDVVVHSLTSYLTVHSAMQTRAEMMEQREAEAGSDEATNEDVAADRARGVDADQDQEEQSVALGGGAGVTSGLGGTQGNAQQKSEEEAAGGSATSGQPGGILPGALNLNFAPGVVLKSLFDDRDVPPQFWDEVLVWRNEEEEDESSDEEVEPMLDEFGEEIPNNKIFDTPNRLNELEYWENIDPILRNDIKQHVDVKSEVFTIYVTARVSTTGEAATASSRLEQEELEQSLGNLRRTVACTVWRQGSGEDAQIVPIIRWEVLDYMPYEVLDFPEDER